MPVKRRRRQRGGDPPGGMPLDKPAHPIINEPNLGENWIEHRGTIARMPKPRSASAPPSGLLDKIKNFLKRGRYASRGLRAVGARGLADKVAQSGYGRGGGLAGYQAVLKQVRAQHPNLAFRAQQKMASQLYKKK